MRLATVERRRAWALAQWGAAGLLALVALALIPPGTLPSPPSSSISDAAIAHWPNAHFLRESVLVHHQWPLWNPLRMLGQPFAANPLSKVWYPPQWLVLIFPPTIHLNLLVYLHLVWLGLGMVNWARAERLHPLVGVFAALAWGLNPKLVAHLGAGHLDIVYALAWAPWLLWGLRTLVEPRDGEQQSPLKGVARLGAVAALLALADLRVAFYLLPAGALYALTLWLQLPRPARGTVAVRALLAAGLFLLLTAVQTAPLLALGSSLTRAAIGAEEAAVYSLPVGHLAGLLLPDPGGFQEWMTYLGLPVVALAVAQLLRGERRAATWLWAAVVLLSGLWALGENGPLFLPVARALPVVGWVRVPSRAWFVVALGCVVLSSWGLDHLLSTGLRSRGRLAAAALAVAGLVWMAAARVMLPAAPSSLWLSGLALAATGAGLWALGAGLDRRALGLDGRVWGGLILSVTLGLSLGLMARSLVAGRTLAELSAGDRAIIAALDGAAGRVYAPSFDLIGPAAADAGIQTLHGVDPFQLAWSAEAIREAAGVSPQGYRVTAPPLPPGDAVDHRQALADAQPDARRLASLGVSHVVARFPVDAPGLQLQEEAAGIHVYRVEGGTPQIVALGDIDAPLVPAPRDGAATNQGSPNRALSARVGPLPVDEPVMLVLPQAWAPGWIARVDGERVPVLRVGGVFAGVQVDPGRVQSVGVVYRPLPDLLGLSVSGLTTVAMLGWSLLHAVRARLPVARRISHEARRA